VGLLIRHKRGERGYTGALGTALLTPRQRRNDSPAQGNALGTRPKPTGNALKGRNFGEECGMAGIALSGLFRCGGMRSQGVALG